MDELKDSTLQTGTRAGRFETPDALYQKYLSTINKRSSFANEKREFKKRTTWKQNTITTKMREEEGKDAIVVISGATYPLNIYVEKWNVSAVDE